MWDNFSASKALEPCLPILLDVMYFDLPFKFTA